MKLDIRQVLDMTDECGFVLLEKGKPQSKNHWNVDSVYELENEFKKVTLSFTIDPTPGYLSSVNARRSKKPVNTLDEVLVHIVDKTTGEVHEEAFDLRNSDSQEVARLKRLLIF
ncbi:hypothetical protein [Fluviicola sp.]|uniref:hypothetical protein n=1 Tax=Fluviicola sp. TaxID=1917219 RepID=UPI0031D37CE3